MKLFLSPAAHGIPFKNIDHLYMLAFNGSMQADIITDFLSGNILLANAAACNLFGYTQQEICTKSSQAIFSTDENFKRMISERSVNGHSSAFLTAIRKNGFNFKCAIQSSVFNDAVGTQKVITSITDMRQSMLRQKNIDLVKEKLVADNIDLAKSEQKKIDIKNDQMAADNISFARAEAREEERSDIGKELHDNVNQLLGASRLYLNMAKLGGKDSELYMSRSSEYTMTAIEAIRKLSKGLTTDIIRILGLKEAINKLVNDTMEMSNLDIDFMVTGFIEECFVEKFRLNIFRIVQEQLNNIVKHAEAAFVHINLVQEETILRLDIIDDGNGFDTDQPSEGIGVANIMSRIKTFNGTAILNSSIGKGCSLEVIFTLPAEIFKC